MVAWSTAAVVCFLAWLATHVWWLSRRDRRLRERQVNAPKLDDLADDVDGLRRELAASELRWKELGEKIARLDLRTAPIRTLR